MKAFFLGCVVGAFAGLGLCSALEWLFLSSNICWHARLGLVIYAAMMGGGCADAHDHDSGLSPGDRP